MESVFPEKKMGSSPHIMRKKSVKSPYLDNRLQPVATVVYNGSPTSSAHLFHS